MMENLRAGKKNHFSSSTISQDELQALLLKSEKDFTFEKITLPEDVDFDTISLKLESDDILKYLLESVNLDYSVEQVNKTLEEDTFYKGYIQPLISEVFEGFFSNCQPLTSLQLETGLTYYDQLSRLVFDELYFPRGFLAVEAKKIKNRLMIHARIMWKLLYEEHVEIMINQTESLSMVCQSLGDEADIDENDGAKAEGKKTRKKNPSTTEPSKKKSQNAGVDPRYTALHHSLAHVWSVLLTNVALETGLPLQLV
jgi:hypothetical protein